MPTGNDLVSLVQVRVRFDGHMTKPLFLLENSIFVVQNHPGQNLLSRVKLCAILRYFRLSRLYLYSNALVLKKILKGQKNNSRLQRTGHPADDVQPDLVLTSKYEQGSKTKRRSWFAALRILPNQAARARAGPSPHITDQGALDDLDSVLN